MTYPILPLTPAAFTVEVLNSANNDLMRLWRLEARIDTYLSVVSPARTRPQQLQPLFVAQLPPPPPSPAPVTAVAAESTTGAPRGRGKKGVATKRVTKAAAAKLSCAAASTSSLDTVDADTSPTSASASASSLAPSSLDHMQQDVDVVEHDVDLDFDCRVETIERLPRPIAAALTLGSTPRGADMDKIKLYGILAASYLATSALYKVVQPCSSAQEYFAQRFRLSRAQLARILHAAQVILDLSAMPRDPVDLVPFPLSLDVACAVHKCAGPSRRARRALWSAVLLTSSPTGGENNDGDLDQQDERDEGEARQQRGITRRDVERAMPLVVKHGIQFYLDAASVDVNSGSVEEQHHEHDFAPSSSRAGSPLLLGSAVADENQPQTSTSTSTSGRPVKGVRYRDLELSASSSSLSSSADGSLRFHPYARRASGMITSTSDKHEYVTPPDTPANALLYGADGAAPASRDKQDRPTPVLPVWKRNVPGAAAMDDAEDADHMDVDEEVAESDQQREEQTRAQEQEGVDMADVSPSSIMSPPTSPTVGTMPSDSVLFGGPSPSRLRGNSAVSIDLLVAAADFVEQQERRASVSSAATSVPPMSPTAGQFVVELESTLAAARASRGPPQYPIEFVMIPFGAAAQQQQQNLSKSSSTSGRGVSPLSLEFSMAAAKMMMPSPSPSPSPSPVHCNADDAQQAKGATPELGHLYASSLASMSSPPRSTSSSPFGVIATSSSSRSPSPVAPIAPRSALSQVAARSMPGGMLEECEA